MNPTVVPSAPEFGVFSVSVKNLDPGTYTITLPAGTYSMARSFIAPIATPWPDRAYLNLYCKNPNAAAPIEAGLQLLNRFNIGYSGDAWQEHSIPDLTVDSAGRELILECGTIGSGTCVFLLKLFGVE